MMRRSAVRTLTVRARYCTDFAFFPPTNVPVPGSTFSLFPSSTRSLPLFFFTTEAGAVSFARVFLSPSLLLFRLIQRFRTIPMTLTVWHGELWMWTRAF